MVDLAQEIRNLAPAEFAAVAGFLAVCAAGCFFAGFRWLRRAQAIANIPTSKVRSAAQGYVELVGEAALLPGEPIFASLTGTVCAWFHCRVEERVTTHDARGRRQTHWNTLRDERSDGLFLLRDGTGNCIVDPDGAHVVPSVTLQWYATGPDWHGPAPTGRGLLASGHFRFTESRIHGGDPLYAIGEFRTGNDVSDAAPLADEVRALLAAWKRDQPMLLSRFDTNGDGQIDLQEWEAARRAAESEVAKGRANRAAEPGVNLMSRPPQGQPYLLSTVPEEKLLMQLRTQSAGALVLFLTGVVVLAWMLSIRFAAVQV